MSTLSDAGARSFAVDPRQNVVLEASAGTGKTTVLVSRYLNLLAAGVDPSNILAITFTRKAAAEMRDRIIGALRVDGAASLEGRRRWRELRDRIGDIAISTIDAFCLSLLREFPLEADLDPAFRVADETDVAQLAEETLDHVLRVARGLSAEADDLALVLTTIPGLRLRRALRYLLGRRLVAPGILGRWLGPDADGLTEEVAAARCRVGILEAFRATDGDLEGFLADGPVHDARFALLSAELRALEAVDSVDPPVVRALVDQLGRHVLTLDRQPRRRLHGYEARAFASRAARTRHARAVEAVAGPLKVAMDRFERDLGTLLVRGVRRLFLMTVDRYRRLMLDRGLVDFPEALERSVALLRQMDEFAQSRYRLESRYHHVLVDEFQDTSRLQWELVSLLVQSWGEGAGLVHEAPLPPSIFIVGDRKQSIYRFRDADVSLLDDAARAIERLRPAGQPRRWITRSYRARPELLAFVNDLFTALQRDATRRDAFSYDERDRFPEDWEAGIETPGAESSLPSALREPILGLGLVSTDGVQEAARAVASEVARILAQCTVRDRHTGLARSAGPGDVAILFRARESHREFERALAARSIPSYVYKGLGFFETNEVIDLVALLRYLASPHVPSAAAALLRSRFIRLSDAALRALRNDLPGALTGESAAPLDLLDPEDQRVLTLVQEAVPRWLSLVDRLPTPELLDLVLADTAYLCELEGPRHAQAVENVKKMRALVRRLQNRGYATLGRIAAHLDQLSTGDESNAVIDAVDAVNLMTVHAAKGLEFPVVFVVNLERGTGGAEAAIRLVARGEDGEPAVAVGPFRSNADDEEREAEVEETRRLLYVATTRARDALYLVARLDGGRFKPGRGSLGAVLPRSFYETLEQAGRLGPAGGHVVWEGRRGRAHDLRVCPSLDERPPRDAAVLP